MMRKRDEGYALAFVLVVVVVICLVAVSMMTVSLRNLEAQTASVERMKDKYEAQGIVEQIVSSIDLEFKCAKLAVAHPVESSLEYHFRELNSAVKDVEVNVANATEGNSFTAKLVISALSNDGSVQVNAVIAIVANVTDGTNEYIVSNPNVTYISHEVVSNGGGA